MIKPIAPRSDFMYAIHAQKAETFAHVTRLRVPTRRRGIGEGQSAPSQSSDGGTAAGTPPPVNRILGDDAASLSDHLTLKGLGKWFPKKSMVEVSKPGAVR